MYSKERDRKMEKDKSREMENRASRQGGELGFETGFISVMPSMRTIHLCRCGFLWILCNGKCIRVLCYSFINTVGTSTES